MATFTTVQSGSLLDPATFGGSLPTSTDGIEVAHTGCSVPIGTTLTIAGLTTGTSSTRMPITLDGELIVTGTIYSRRSNAVNVSASGSLVANVVDSLSSWEDATVVNTGGSVAIALINISANGQPLRGFRQTAGNATVNQITMVNNVGNVVYGVLISGGTVNFSGSVQGGRNNDTFASPHFEVSNGTLNLLALEVLLSTSVVRLINQTGGVINFGEMTLHPNTRQDRLIYSAGGTLNFTNAIVNVLSGSLLEIIKTNGTVNLTNCSINADGDLFFRNVSGSNWITNGFLANLSSTSSLLSYNIGNLSSASGSSGLPIGRLISGGV